MLVALETFHCISTQPSVADSRRGVTGFQQTAEATTEKPDDDDEYVVPLTIALAVIGGLVFLAVLGFAFYTCYRLYKYVITHISSLVHLVSHHHILVAAGRHLRLHAHSTCTTFDILMSYE